jgi:hypothetical protein
VKTLDHKHNERGTTIAEFAVVALLFFTLVFGIIEFGRLLYTHNALTDATRRGARYAVLHHGATENDKQNVRNYVVYGPNGTFDADGNPTSSPLVPGLTSNMVIVEFDGVNNGGQLLPFGSNIGSATVKIEDYEFSLNIPVVGRTLTLPAYTTTAMAECAGEIPDPIN